MIILFRLDDVCYGIADGRQEPCDGQLAVSVGLSGVLQRPLGCNASCPHVSVMGCADSRPEAPEAVNGIEAKRVTESSESTQRHVGISRR